MKILAFIFVCQVLSSTLRTLSINALVGRKIIPAITVTAVSDFVLLSSWVGIMHSVNDGSQVGIGVAVAGSAVGNFFAMFLKRRLVRGQ